jgi:hypothetical protein
MNGNRSREIATLLGDSLGHSRNSPVEASGGILLIGWYGGGGDLDKFTVVGSYFHLWHTDPTFGLAPWHRRGALAGGSD